MTCNCNRNGDVEYSITLNQQGPQGRQGNAGQNGFSPSVTVVSNTSDNYQLKIISADGEIVTPNLKANSIDTSSFVNVYDNQAIRGIKTFYEPVNIQSNLTCASSIDMFSSRKQVASVYSSLTGSRMGVHLDLYLADTDVYINNKKVITEVELDELADDVVDINSQLGGLQFKKYTRAEYNSIANPDENTIYFVKDSDTFSIYLGSLPLAGGGGGVSGYGILTAIAKNTTSNVNRVTTNVTAQPYTA